MSRKREPDPGMKVIGCLAFKEWFAAQKESVKQMIRDRISVNTSLFPCPKCNGNWAYKKDCVWCHHAKKAPVVATGASGEKTGNFSDNG